MLGWNRWVQIGHDGLLYFAQRNETERNQTGYLRVRYAKCENSFFAKKRIIGPFLQVREMQRRITRVFQM